MDTTARYKHPIKISNKQKQPQYEVNAIRIPITYMPAQ